MGRSLILCLLFAASVVLGPGCVPVENGDLPVNPAFNDDDRDGVSPAQGDCDDTDPDRYEGALERCDGKDQDCDGTVDESLDQDGDGYTGCGTGPTGLDCEDTDAEIYPGAIEVCDGVDNNCNDETDELFDSDGDGYSACPEAAGATDCDDDDKGSYPGNPNPLCDGKDNDCDTDADEGFDSDGDGFHICALDGKAADCDDRDDDVYPGADEACNGDDDDCDGTSDEGFDADRDGFEACDPLSPNFDCDDGDRAINPDADEVCAPLGGDAVDEDCDGLADDDDPDVTDPGTFFADTDGDGFGDAGEVTQACVRPPGHSLQGGDCDDSDPSLNPDTVSYPDLDGDGFGDPDGAQTGCAVTEGWVLEAGDCDDADPATFEGAPELCDGADNDCDSVADEGLDIDGDEDGFLLCDPQSGLEDCDDTRLNTYPSAPELCDGRDNDCDDLTDEDFDLDGDGIPSCEIDDAPADCDDADPEVFPGAADGCDLADNDCDHEIDEDADVDGDGFNTCDAGAETFDCDDADPGVYPGADETCDGRDENCDGDADDGFDEDGDGFPACAVDGEVVDCDDDDPSIYPGRSEFCDGVDTNCSGGSGDIYVSADTAIPADYRTIQGALDGVVGAGCVIEVAPGTYQEQISFKGKGVVLRSQGGPEVTIINGAAVNGVVNSAVRFVNGERSAARLEGFTVTGGGGYDDLRDYPEGGGVMMGTGVSAILRDLIILGNRAEAGGGVACDGCNGARLEDVRILENEAYARVVGGALYFNGAGGGLFVYGGSVVVEDTEITGNLATVQGGGTFVRGSASVSFDRVLTEDNTANPEISGFGGGLAVTETSLATVVDSSFKGNRAFRGGGIFVTDTARVVGLNVSVESNVAVGRDDSDSEGYFAYGGGLYARGTSESKPSVSLNFSEFVANIAGEVQAGRGGGIFSDYATVTLGRSIFEGNASDVTGGMAHLTRSTVTVTNCLFRANVSNFSGGLQLEAGTASTVVNNVFIGNRSLSTELGGSGLLLIDSNGSVFNNIFNQNIANMGGALYYHQTNIPVAAGTVQYNDFWQNSGGDTAGFPGAVIGDNGNLGEDPLFENVSRQDYHLKSTSPLLDVGHPDAAYNDADATRNDLGIFGGPSGAWTLSQAGSSQ